MIFLELLERAKGFEPSTPTSAKSERHAGLVITEKSPWYQFWEEGIAKSSLPILRMYPAFSLGTSKHQPSSGHVGHTDARAGHKPGDPKQNTPERTKSEN